MPPKLRETARVFRQECLSGGGGSKRVGGPPWVGGGRNPSPGGNPAAYFSLLRSSLEYFSAVWDPLDKNISINWKKFKDQQQDLSPKMIDKQPVWHLSFRTWAALTWKQDEKNSRLSCKFKILNELVEIPINDRFIPADKRTHGGHNQAYTDIRANTTLGQNSFWHRTIPDWNSPPSAAIPAGNCPHLTSFQRGCEVEITLWRRLTPIQRRIDVFLTRSKRTEVPYHPPP